MAFCPWRGERRRYFLGYFNNCRLPIADCRLKDKSRQLTPFSNWQSAIGNWQSAIHWHSLSTKATIQRRLGLAGHAMKLGIKQRRASDGLPAAHEFSSSANLLSR
jgi:hypothetical protein